jgi:hypothetical protein
LDYCFGLILLFLAETHFFLALLDIALSDESPHERTVKIPADDIDGLLVGG